LTASRRHQHLGPATAPRKPAAAGPRRLSCYDLSPADIELEVTESTAMQNPEVTLSILDQLAAMGIMLAIDDFGTGYSSLAYLKHLPIQRLKLDRSFVTDIETDPTMPPSAPRPSPSATAWAWNWSPKGVETEAQREFLTRLDCDVLQGYLFSKPLPFEEIVSLPESPSAQRMTLRHSARSSAPAPDCSADSPRPARAPCRPGRRTGRALVSGVKKRVLRGRPLPGTNSCRPAMM
jgi:predicted signal transduction protein with EAL and GGDEF domain